MDTYKTYGFLKYDPQSTTTRFDPWWLAVMCPVGLAKFYQDLISKEAIKVISSGEAFGMGNWPVTKRGVKVATSVWGPHVSLVRGEEPYIMEAWKKYDGQKIYFEYEPVVRTNGCHYWLPVHSRDFEDIRIELGLPRQTRAPFHFTIGRDVDAPSSKEYRSRLGSKVIRNIR